MEGEDNILMFNKIDTTNDHLDRKLYCNTNDNLININYDIQGLRWRENEREKNLKFRHAHHKGFRNIRPITLEEKTKREFFHLSKKSDIFYQFKRFVPNLQVYITHFQVRKNFILLDNKEIIYTKELGIESYNLLTNKKQTLCNLSMEDRANPTRSVICFDVIKNYNNDYLICTGRCDGSVNLYKIPYEEIKKLKGAKYDKIPKFEQYLNREIAHGNEEDTLTTYVKFFDGGRQLLTCHNDGYVRIFDLNEDLKIIIEYKGDAAINYCSYNNNNSALSCIGDSTDIEIFDVKSCKKIHKYKAHYDYGTVIKFQPGSDYTFASGNQDYSGKIWDLRKVTSSDRMLKEVQTVFGFNDSIGDLLFISNDFLVLGENLDHLHIHNLKTNYTQTMTYLGSMAGIVYNNINEEIYVGTVDQNMQFTGIISYDKMYNYQTSLSSVFI